MQLIDYSQSSTWNAVLVLGIIAVMILVAIHLRRYRIFHKSLDISVGHNQHRNCGLVGEDPGGTHSIFLGLHIVIGGNRSGRSGIVCLCIEARFEVIEDVIRIAEVDGIGIGGGVVDRTVDGNHDLGIGSDLDADAVLEPPDAV